MQQRFTGKKVLVTGAASGIGKATALRLAAEGGHVWCVDLTAEGAAATEQLIREQGGVAESSACDVSEFAQASAVVEKLIATWGSLDVLCNIAGIGSMVRFLNETPEHFAKMLAVNLTGPFNFCLLAMPHLLKSKGNIVNLASTAGKMGQAYTSAYCASKHGLIGLTRSLAMEYGREGVRANSICPGAIKTPLVRDFHLPEGVDLDLIGRYNFQRFFAEASEVAAMIAYVASDEARYVNGAEFSIDGGITTG